MRKFFLTATMLAFSMTAIAKEDQSKAQELTWSQWFGQTATLAWAYKGVSTQFPALQRLNSVVATHGADIATKLAGVVMNKLAKKQQRQDTMSELELPPVTDSGSHEKTE